MNKNFPAESPIDAGTLASAALQYSDWRNTFLNLMMRIISLTTFIALPLGILQPEISLVRVAVYIGLFLVLTAVAFISLPYWLRSVVLISVFFFVGLVLLIARSIYADATIFFLAFSLVATLLFDIKAGLIATAISLITIMVVGWYYVTNAISLGTGDTYSGLPINWIILSFDLLLASMAINFGVWLLQTEFNKLIQRSRAAFEEIIGQQAELEQRVEEHTVGLTQKTEQLRAASYVARKTAEVQDLASLLRTVAKLVSDQFGFYHTGIFLINEIGDQAVLQAASSEGGQRMLEAGYSSPVGAQETVGYVASQKKHRIALDVGADAILFNNPDLPLTHSEVALPLIVRNKLLGVLDIQSSQPQAFRVDDIDVLQTLADQIAIAIENARLMDETQTAIMQLEALTSLRTREAWSQKLREKNRVFTYTPLGLRAEKLSQSDDKAIRVPIILRGQKIGSISISRKSDATWTKLDKDLIEEIAVQAGLAVENIRLLEEATQRAEQEQTVGTLAARFSQSLDLDTLLQTAARELGQLPNISEVSVFIGQQSEQAPASKQRAKHQSS